MGTHTQKFAVGVVLVDAQERSDVRVAFEYGVEVVVQEVVERRGQDCGARRISGTDAKSDQSNV